MAEQDGRKWLTCLGWGCLTAVVVFALAIGGCVAYFYKEGSGAHAVAEAYLEAADAGRYEDAFATLGPGFTEQRGLAEFAAFERAARAELGVCGDWRTRGTSFNHAQGRSVAQLRFHGSCDGESATVTFSLEEVDRQWVIQDIRYNEPATPVIPVCADCGLAVPPDARFCPACGAAVGGESGPSDPPDPPDSVPGAAG
jgi:hypothetical protein